MTQNLKILIDSGPLSTGDSIRGIGVYTRELTTALSKIDNKDEIKIKDVFNENLNNYDVIHFTRFNPFKISVPFTKPLKTKFVLTIYDLIPLIYPTHYPPGIKGFITWQINKYLIKKNVDTIITISETSKKDICRFIGVSPKKVSVVYLAPREIFKKISNTSLLHSIKIKYKLPQKFALYVGDVNYNKNIIGLINEANKLKLPLVIAGKKAIEVEKMDLNHPELVHLKEVNWKNTIRIGFVPDEDLVKIYNLAEVYLQMSLYEGFGLPLVEAKACGTKILYSKTQAFVEIMELDNLSWEKTANETLQVYNG